MSMLKISPQVSLMAFEGAREILGEKELAALAVLPATTVKPVYSIYDVSRFRQALERAYGAPGGQGVVLRSGRAAFKYALSRWGDDWGFTQNEFRLLPTPRRMRAGLDILAGFFSKECDSTITVEPVEGGWIWTCSISPELAAGRVAELWMMGLLQAFLSWASGGKAHQLTPMDGGKQALTCSLRLDAKALD